MLIQMAKKSMRRVEKIVPYLFLAPFFTGLGVFWVYPTLYSFYLAFFKQTGFGQGKFIGFQNFLVLLSDTRFVRSIVNTTYYAGASVFIILPVALFVAFLLRTPKLPFSQAFRIGYFLPMVTSGTAVAIIFILIFDHQYGILNYALTLLNLPRIKWLLDPRFVMPSLVLIGLWKWTGINALYFYAGLQGIPREVEEAALVDGASGWQCFWFVTLPLLRPILTFTVTLAIIGSYQLFAEPYLLAGEGGGPGDAGLFATVYLYITGFRALRFGYASAIGCVLFGIIFSLSLIQLKAMGAFKD